MRESPGGGVGGSHMPSTGLRRLIGTVLLAHVVASGIDSNEVTDESVPDRAGRDAGAETVAPVHLQTLPDERRLLLSLRM